VRAFRATALASVLGAVVLAGCGTKTITVERTVTRVQTVAAPPTATSTAPEPCAGGALAGTLANESGSPFVVSGLPDVRLLDERGAELPTEPTAARPGLPAAVRVELAPGAAAAADARFSPDVPGPGETQAGRCEPSASTLRVSAPGGGTVAVPVRPPTPVCEHGALRFEVYAAAR
jgi:hypothetical protein